MNVALRCGGVVVIVSCRYFDLLMQGYSAWVVFMELARLREAEKVQRAKRFDEEFPEAPHSKTKVVLRDMLGLVDKLMNSKLRANWEFLECVLL